MNHLHFLVSTASRTPGVVVFVCSYVCYCADNYEVHEIHLHDCTCI